MMLTKKEKELLAENKELQTRLSEAEEALRAIRSGEVDALVVSTGDQEHIFTLKGAEQTYRLLVEEMNEGAATLTTDGMILYANHRLAEMLDVSLERLIGTTLQSWVTPNNHEHLHNMMQLTPSHNKQRGELNLLSERGTTFPTLCSFNLLHTDSTEPVISLVVTDITEQVRLMQLEFNERETHARLEESEKARASLLSMLEDQKEIEIALRESEERYRLVIENAIEIIYSIDLKGYYTYVNPAGLEVTGYSLEELRNLTYLDVILPEYRTRVKHFYLKQYLEKKPAKYFRFPFRTKSGNVVWFEQNSMLLFEKDTVVGFQFIARDITLRKQMEDALFESDRLFHQLTDNIAEVFWLVDTIKNRFVFISPTFEQIWGRSRDSLYATPQKWIAAIHPDDSARVAHAVETKQLSGLYNETYRIVRPDGSVRWIHDRAFPVKDERGRVYRIAGIAEDITAQKQIEEERKNLESQLQQSQKLQSLGTLASGIAHDFNNILGIIIAHSSMLLKRSATPDIIQKSSEAITKAGMRGAALVKQMLTFARKTDVNISIVQVNDIVNEVSKLLHETFPKTIVVELHLENKLPPIAADATQIHQVLLNLCVNARDAMHNIGTLTVTTQVQPGASLRSRYPKALEDEYIELSVRDTGIGMSEETKQRIFEPFFTTKEIGKGTGLGLSLVFGIMETHSGFVEVESELGKGTVFHCYFPVMKHTENEMPQNKQTRETIDGGTETILLVEDEKLLVDLVKQLLEGKGYTVLVAGDGEEGLAIYKENRQKIHLIISDMGLPKFGGYELFQKIKAMDAHVRLIFASGYIEPGTKEKILNEGVKQFIQKPYDLDEVLRAVRDALQ